MAITISLVRLKLGKATENTKYRMELQQQCLLRIMSTTASAYAVPAGLEASHLYTPSSLTVATVTIISFCKI